ncbi:hypothetical protein [Phenylobacterium sp.]|jgi:hypothetical protein|uniref:hypothetical protein n=1 Tax=Phenylobacterium sp. TaxID=1871053 RepID=UPI002E2F14A7|nr:hypothetical protein [Phenylobacterium sp.]HEX3366550.1 hypothetical protein [Phenylobacterium sp.]
MIDRRSLFAAAGALAAWPAGAKPAPAPPADLTGAWTNAWYTKLQRPKAFTALVATPAEAQAYETPRRKLRGELSVKEDELGQNESENPDNGPGLARIGGQIRTSWITDPADGRIPYRPDVPKAVHLDLDTGDYDNVEARDTDERCLTNASGAAPLVNSHDANLIQIVQTPSWVAIVGEKDHEARIVEIAGPGRDPPRRAGRGSWTGASVGHWEGATLVVETTDLRPGLTKIGLGLFLSEHSRVTERFTRTGPTTVAYQFEVSDPTLFTQVWRGEEVFRTAEGLMYEYACHEGNYSLPTILRAARAADGKPAASGK